MRTQSRSCWLLSPWIPIAGHLSSKHACYNKKPTRRGARTSESTHPSRRILRVRSSHRLFVSTKMMVLFSFSLMISSSSRMSLGIKMSLSGRVKASTGRGRTRPRRLLVFLLSVVADVDDLQDVVVGAELQGPDVDLHVLLQEVLGQLPDLFGPGGAPHQRLAVGLRNGPTLGSGGDARLASRTRTQAYSDLVYDFADLRLEAHVQHPVGLVQHQVRASAEISLS